MPSPTVRVLSQRDVARLVAVSFGAEAQVAKAWPLHGGGFAAVWQIRLSGGRHVVLKVAPPAGVGLLGYEQSLVGAEAEYFALVRRHAPGVPVPEVLHHGTDRSVLDGDWLFTAALPGIALPDLLTARPSADIATVRRDLGAAVAQIHQISGTRFGYTGQRPSAHSWPVAFTAIIDSLLADAAAWAVELGDRPERIRKILSDHLGVLADVTQPTLLHFDLWDGNVLATSDPGQPARLSGLVDGERYLFGDPLIDFVSPALFGRIEEDPGHPFVVGYVQQSNTNPLQAPSALGRLALYRLHLYLVMLVEMPSRGEAGPAHDRRRHFLMTLLDRELTNAS